MNLKRKKEFLGRMMLLKESQESFVYSESPLILPVENASRNNSKEQKERKE